MKKFLSLLLSVMILVSALFIPAYAEESADPTGFGVNSMSYTVAKLAVTLENLVFDFCNLLAGIVDILDTHKRREV